MAEPLRLLVLGASGMLGRALVEELCGTHRLLVTGPPGQDIPGAERVGDRLDAETGAGLPALLELARPDVVVNCIAVTSASPAFARPDICLAVNGVFPHRLAEATGRAGVRLIHMSTDGVYSGKAGPHPESELPDPPDRYGRSKLAGEPDAPHCLVLRGTFVGPSPTRRGLVEWLLRQRAGRIEGYQNYSFSPLSLTGMSRLIGRLAEMGAKLSGGVYHAAGPAVSKYELLAGLVARLRLPLEVVPVPFPRIDRRLDDSLLRDALGGGPPTFQAMIEEMCAWIGGRDAG
jgi:dTDP-4-dehydrorhamnose reductase